MKSVAKLIGKHWRYVFISLFLPTTVIAQTSLIEPAPALPFAEMPVPVAPVSLQIPTLEAQQLNCNPSQGSGGLSAGTHDTMVAGRPATVIVGTGYSPQSPTYLAFYLHGDEGGYNFHTSGFNPINQFINQHNWIYVAPLSLQANDGLHRWYANPAENETLLRNVLSEMFNNYNVCQNILFAASASGGSVFYTRSFFPNSGGDYPAFASVNCGAGSSSATSWQQNLQALSQNADIVARSQFKFTVGTDDFLYDQVVNVANTYNSTGLNVITNYLANVAHCAYNLPVEISDYWLTKLEEIEQTTDPDRIFESNFEN